MSTLQRNGQDWLDGRLLDNNWSNQGHLAIPADQTTQDDYPELTVLTGGA